MRIRIALVGIGKIARDQHMPAIAGNENFILTATVSRQNPQLDVPHFSTLDALLASDIQVDAVALCTPPQVRYDAAKAALDRELHVFLEKPPGATLAEVDALRDHAEKVGVTLFASWHSRYAAGVKRARNWLADKRIDSVSIIWREDVRAWHPGQAWIWEPGGLGVFDPGINALSIVTHILPRPFFLTNATLTLPENRATPIAAEMIFADTAGAPITMDLDWRQTGPQSWDIVVETDAGQMSLSKGGAVLTLPGVTDAHEDCEYPGLYAHFAQLVREGMSDVDTRPLQLVADAFLRGGREVTEAFHD